MSPEHKAYRDAIRNLSPEQIDLVESEESVEGSLLEYARECYEEWQALLDDARECGVKYSSDSRFAQHHPV